MIAADNNFVADQSSAFLVGVELRLGTDVIKFEGAKPRMDLTDRCSGEVVLGFNEEDGTMTDVDMSLGQFTLAAKDTDMAIPHGLYNYDLALIAPDNDTRVLRGTFTVRKSITRES